MSAARRLPAEWEPQSGVLLGWPHAGSDWAPVLAQVEPVFTRIALEVSRRETLLLVCNDATLAARVRDILHRAGADGRRVLTAIAPCNDTWARDYGPIGILANGRPCLLDFRFNGWGEKHPWQHDDAVTAALAAGGCFGSTPTQRLSLILEGGSIDSDGQGTLLTTRRCLLHPRRNPALSPTRLEQRLRELLGCERVLWLQHGGLVGDDTDGHVDMLARFAGPGTLLYQSCSERGYPLYNELEAMKGELQRLRDAGGRTYETVPLPWPGPVQDEKGRRLPASYANFLVIDGAVLVPAYDDAADDEAARRIQACFPQRELVQVPCRPLLQQGGSLHCLTMQLPRGIPLTECAATTTHPQDRP